MDTPNLLVILADDVGTDQVGAYHESPAAPPTPAIDALASQGVLFRNAYANPLCSTTRAALLTGRYGRRYGIGGIIELDESTWELPLAEVLLPEALERGGTDWKTAAVGKWHLSGFRTENAFRHPLLQGFDHFAGSLGNLASTSRDWGTRGNFHHWEKDTDGSVTWVERYATTDTADDAVRALDTLAEPWFLYLAFNAAHEPYDPPPASLLEGRIVTADDPHRVRHAAVVQAMDAELGRVLASIPPEVRALTVIVFMGDNGTPGKVIGAPFDEERAKGTTYEGGTGVPLIVTGPGVAVGESQALVHAVDVMPTLLELAAVPVDGLVLDGVSFAPLLVSPGLPGTRRMVFTERFNPIGAGPYRVDSAAVRDERYRLVRGKDDRLTMFDLQGQAGEGRVLRRLDPEQRAARDRLQAEMDRLTALPFEYAPTPPAP
jgi:arylsulfatase A-like enzyme